MENISLVEIDQISVKIQIIMRQTNYTDEQAMQKLKEFKYNEMDVIRDYFGIKERKSKPITSVNQEIYKQLRGHLDSVMRDYQSRVDKGESKKLN